MHSSQPFGSLPSGEQVDLHTLENSTGFSVGVLTLGGIITSILAPDRAGRLDDVVLGLPSLDGYLTNPPYFGAIIGRVAGRVSNAQFTMDGRTYPLVANDGANHLHGGLQGFDKKVWSAARVEREDNAPSLRLFRVSPDGEEGYPGNLSVAITYTLAENNTLIIESEATTDKATPLSLTSHSYFNLAGERSGASVSDHVLMIDADSYAPADAAMTILGTREGVTAANDFRSPRQLGAAIPNLHLGHGEMYFLGERLDSPKVVAVVEHPASGRTLAVATTEPCLQFYTGASLDGTISGKSGRPYDQYTGLCLECQGHPDGTTSPSLGDITLRPGETRRGTTSYTFSTTA